MNHFFMFLLLLVPLLSGFSGKLLVASFHTWFIEFQRLYKRFISSNSQNIDSVEQWGDSEK